MRAQTLLQDVKKTKPMRIECEKKIQKDEEEGKKSKRNAIP